MANNDWVDDYLMHHGVKGQKKGIHTYQNPDGSFTDRGRERYLDQLEKVPHWSPMQRQYYRKYRPNPGQTAVNTYNAYKASRKKAYSIAESNSKELNSYRDVTARARRKVENGQRLNNEETLNLKLQEELERIKANVRINQNE